jgi:parvulin-like peptidyl-prolyl isomerase
MLKNFLIVLLTISWLNAGLINAIAVKVNNSVITMYDIDKIMIEQKLSQNEAVRVLIDSILYNQEIKRFDISVLEAEVSTYISNIAQSNKMSVVEFKQAIKKQNNNYNTFLEDIKKRILNQKLISHISKGKLKIANDEDLKLYYDNNINQFRVSKNSIQVVSFEKAKNKIFNIIMSQREKQYLKEYFETLKITADIKVVR